MGIFDRVTRFTQSPGRRPKGGTSLRDAYVPPEPSPAPGQPPPSPADAFAAAKVAPPRPLVWVGTATSGSQVWSSPLAGGVGLRLWSDLRAVATEVATWPVLTGESPIPTSWHLDTAHRLQDVAQLPDAEALLAAALERAPEPPEGLRTRLEPSAEATVEADLAAGYLALVTDTQNWQVPISVGFDGVGGWAAVEHASILRHWSARYKAEVVALTQSSVGLRIGRPPASHEAAYATAQEIYAYCPDVVEHGLGSMWALATTVAVSPAWSLRWSPSSA